MRTKAILPILYATINRGSQMYNEGNISGCSSLYESTSQELLQRGVEGYSKQMLEDALGKSVSSSPNEKAWNLRHAFDAILSYADTEVEDLSESSNVPKGEIITMDVVDFLNNRDISPWYEMHDGVMGGVSSGKLLLISDSVVFTGTVRTEYNGGFASIRRQINLDASGFDGIYLDIRSSTPNRVFSFDIKDSQCQRMGGVNFKQKFRINTTELKRIYLPFTNFNPEFRGRAVSRAPLDTFDIKEISFMAFKPAGEFELSISKIGLYKASS
jgi:hypothetical protein